MPRYKVPNLNLKTMEKIVNVWDDKKGFKIDKKVNVPVQKNINSKVLAAVLSNGNQLQMQDYHYCKTSHCRAGWTIHECGKQGYDLEKQCGGNPEMAANLILEANYPNKKLPNFFTGNDRGLEELIEDAIEDYNNRIGTTGNNYGKKY